MKRNFEWDEEKARKNLQKHGVSFEEAETVFDDPLAITKGDPRHSFDEERLINIGASVKNRVLVVVYTERGENVRIINSRKATANERMKYEEGYE